MPSGQTHDRITLWSLPVVAAIAFGQTQSGNITLILSGAYLFSGLMFGPDLDLYSRQYQRWGCVRWIWIHYQKTKYFRTFPFGNCSICVEYRVELANPAGNARAIANSPCHRMDRALSRTRIRSDEPRYQRLEPFYI